MKINIRTIKIKEILYLKKLYERETLQVFNEHIKITFNTFDRLKKRAKSTNEKIKSTSKWMS